MKIVNSLDGLSSNTIAVTRVDPDNGRMCYLNGDCIRDGNVELVCFKSIEVAQDFVEPHFEEDRLSEWIILDHRKTTLKHYCDPDAWAQEIERTEAERESSSPSIFARLWRKLCSR
jgi:hypothetical protein